MSTLEWMPKIVLPDQDEIRPQMLEFLKTCAEVGKRCFEKNMLAFNYKGPKFYYYSAEDFVLQHGEWFDKLPSKPHWRGPLKQCFSNAAYFTRKNKGFHYVEGFALSIIPVHHAWVVDDDKRIYEVTWENPGKAYIGVEFDQKDRGILSDWENDYPLFQQPFKGKS